VIGKDEMISMINSYAPVIQSQGSGYYNYYNISSRYKTEKPSEVWYHKDLSTQEISSNNAGVQNKESANADLYRKLERVYAGLAEQNRAKYRTVDELRNALYAKYSSSGAYAGYSKEQRNAMYLNELSMTCFGTIGNYSGMGGGDELADPHLNGEVTKNAPTDTQEFNRKTLSQQLRNVFANNGLDFSLLGNARFSFSVDGMTKKLKVTLIKDDNANPISEGLLARIEEALNTKENATRLFYNMLYNANHEGTIPADERVKYLLYQEFYQNTGLDIRLFQQTRDGFVNANGEYARDLYKEGLKYTAEIPKEFKGAAYDYFLSLEKEAMKYDISGVSDLTLRMEYQNGIVMPSNSYESINYQV
jgi:hypothetical protein